MIFTALASSFSSSPLPITTTVLCSASFTSLLSLWTMETVAEEREDGCSELDWINRTASLSSPPKCTWQQRRMDNSNLKLGVGIEIFLGEETNGFLSNLPWRLSELVRRR